MIQQFWRICLPFVIALLAAGKFHPLVPLMPNKNQQCWHTLKPSCDREEVMFCTRFHAPPRRRMVTAPVLKANGIAGSYFDAKHYAARFKQVLRNARSYLTAHF